MKRLTRRPAGRRAEPGAAGAPHATQVSSRRAVGDIAFQIGGQVINLSLGVVTTVVLARALGATRYGEWATLLATIELVAMVGNLGLEPVAVRYATQEPEREGFWVGAATSLQLALTVPVLAVFLIMVTVVADGEQMLIAGLILSILFLTAAISTLRVIFRLHVRNHVVVAFITANSIIWTSSVVAIAALGGGLVAFAIAFVVTAILIQGTQALVALHTVQVHWKGARKLWPKLARVGISVGIASALTFAYGRVDQILVYELAPDPAEVGLYAAMYKILDNAGAVPLAVMTTLFPILAGLYPSQPARLKRIMQAAVDYLTVVALGALALTIVAAAPIVALLYGPDYAAGASILPILFAAFVPICIGNVAGNMVVATDLQRQYIWYAGLGLVLNLGLNFFLIPEYGIEAAAWVTFATELIVVSITLFAVLRRMEMTLSIRRLLRAALAAAVAGLALWGLREVGFGAIALILAMTAFYPLALLALRALDLGELRELISARKSAEAPS